jgi:nitrogen-specific signal transduction histidine kinase
VFEPYRTSKQTGSGLGLMIVQRIVDEHGGEIELASKPDVGTCFKVRLPRSERRVRLLTPPAAAKKNKTQTPFDGTPEVVG